MGIYHLFSMKNILAFKDIGSRHFIAKLSKTVDFLEFVYKFYIGHYMKIEVKHKHFIVTNLESSWFVETKEAFTNLIGFIDAKFTSIAVITRLSVHGLFYGMNYLG